MCWHFEGMSHAAWIGFQEKRKDLTRFVEFLAFDERGFLALLPF